MEITKASLFIAVVIVFMALGIFELIHIEAQKSVVVEWPPPRLKMEDCLKSFPSLVDHSTTTDRMVEVVKKIDACQFQLSSQGLLDDFQIRRSKFYQQNYADTVILWMVVFITTSGIALAAIQLFISYKLAIASGSHLGDVGGELSLEQGKVSLKSSLSGAFILMISFAFFWLFVTDIYNIKVIDVDAKIGSGDIISKSQSTPNYVGNDGKVKVLPGIGTFGAPLLSPNKTK